MENCAFCRMPRAPKRCAGIPVFEWKAPAMDARVKRTPGRLDRSRQAAPQIFETLRDRIMSLELKPNTLLSRSALQTEFGISQTPVRDALMKLEQEGLVEIYPQHATVVARIDVDAARQAHFLRVSVELEAVRRIAEKPDAAFIARLRATIGEQRRMTARGDYPGFVAADHAMHQLFCDEARVPDLWQIIRRQCGHIDRLRRLSSAPGKDRGRDPRSRGDRRCDRARQSG